MKIKILTLFFALYQFLGLSAKESIAVWITSDSETPEAYRNVIATSVTQAINDDGHFIAVERVNEFLEVLDSEITFQQSGTVSQDKLVELGKQNGANYVFAISLSKVFDETYASSRIINVEKNAVEAAYGESMQLASMNALKSLSNKIASGTLAKMPYNIEKQKNTEQRRLDAQRAREKEKAEKEKKWSIFNRYRTYRITSGRQLHILNLNYQVATMDEAKEWIHVCIALGQPVPYPVICDVETKEESKGRYGTVKCAMIEGLHRLWDIGYYNNYKWKKKDNLDNEVVGTVLIRRF